MNRRKVMAVLLVLTWPIWVLPVLTCYIVFGIGLVLYTSIYDALGA
jgi:hypothetical protein